MVEFNELPVEIQNRMLDEQVRQGSTRNAEMFEVDITAGAGEGGFSWGLSEERYDFWSEIIVDGNFDVFYERYPRESNIKMYTEEEVRNLLIKRCKRFSTQHEKFDELLLEQDLKWFEENKK